MNSEGIKRLRELATLHLTDFDRQILLKAADELEYPLCQRCGFYHMVGRQYCSIADNDEDYG